MKFSKSTVVLYLGFLALISFIAMSYLNNLLFFKEILICSAIFSMVFFVKMRGEATKSRSITPQREYSKAA